MINMVETATTPAQEAAPSAAQTKAPTRRPRAAAAPGAAPKRKPAKKSEKIIFVKSRRKCAVARASVRNGTGIIRFNGFDISSYEPVELRKYMLEPLHISNITEDFAKGVDISLNVNGGGQSGQAQASRSAIAKGISDFADSDAIRSICAQYDRFLLVDDPRRVEPKKFKGPKARARFQKSYR
jgi:small subunit ribosomal protein S9